MGDILIPAPMKLKAPITILAILLSAGVSQATTVLVLNHSFEDGTNGSGGNVNQPPWRDIANSTNNQIPIQEISALPAGRVDAAPDGTDTVHYTNATTDSIYQVLAATLQANTVYTLRVDVGDRTDLTAQSGAIRLGYVSASPAANDDYGLNLLTANIINDTVPVNGAGATDGWQTWESTFTTGASPTGEGQALRIELVTFAGVQTLWDNVRLDASPVPEPSALLLSALGSFLLLRRRR